MPTGSLCAERNVIGSALADNLGLRRKDFRVLAVYSAGSLSGDGNLSRKPSSLNAESLPVHRVETPSILSADLMMDQERHSPSMRKVTLERAESWTEVQFMGYKSSHEPISLLPQINSDEDKQLSVGRKSYRTIRANQIGSLPSFWMNAESLLYDSQFKTTSSPGSFEEVFCLPSATPRTNAKAPGSVADIIDLASGREPKQRVRTKTVAVEER
jgi:hypothetical protein